MYIARARTGSMCTSRSPDGAVDGGLLRRLGDRRGRRSRYGRGCRSRYRRRGRSRYGHGRRPGRRRVRRRRCRRRHGRPRRRRVRGRRCRRRRADRWFVGGRARRRCGGYGVVHAPSSPTRHRARALRLATEIGRLVDHPWGTIASIRHGVNERGPRLLAADVAVRAVHAHRTVAETYVCADAAADAGALEEADPQADDSSGVVGKAYCVSGGRALKLYIDASSRALYIASLRSRAREYLRHGGVTIVNLRIKGLIS